MSIESEKAIAELNSKINDLKNVHRLVSNNLAIIHDSKVNGSDVRAVAEVVGWLEGFKQSLANQFQALEASLPSKAERLPKPEVVEAQIVEAKT